MAKLFGEYLIERQIVTVDHVLDALMEQLRSVPSTGEIIYELDLLLKPDLLRILAHQQYTGSDFRSSALALNLWGEQLAEKVSAHLQSLRRPLGEILVERGHLSLETLTTTLDAYVEMCSQTTGEEAKPARDERPATKPSSDQVLASKSVSDFSIDPKPQAVQLDPVLVKEYLDCYDSKIGPSLQEITKNLAATTMSRDNLHDLLSRSLGEFVGVRAAAGFLGAKRSEAIADEIVKSLECGSKSDGLIDQKVLHEIVKTSSHILDALAQYLKDFNSEDLLANDPNMKDLAERLAKTHAAIRALQERRAA